MKIALAAAGIGFGLALEASMRVFTLAAEQTEQRRQVTSGAASSPTDRTCSTRTGS
ncbi:MAG: hypothetical protein ACT4QA_20170 [Panacagrimonas sp.]